MSRFYKIGAQTRNCDKRILCGFLGIARQQDIFPGIRNQKHERIVISNVKGISGIGGSKNADTDISLPEFLTLANTPDRKRQRAYKPLETGIRKRLSADIELAGRNVLQQSGEPFHMICVSVC